MLNELKEDWKELCKARDELQLRKFKGSSLGCGCGNKGNFGARMIYITKSKRQYRICGWCGHITSLS